MFDLFHQEIPETLKIRVTPKASSHRIKVELTPEGERLFRVYVTTAAEGGKANEALLSLLAKHLGLPKTSLKIIQGFKTRHKLVRITKA